MAARLRAWRFAANISAALRPLDRMSAHVAERLFPQARILPPPDFSHAISAAPGGRVLGVLSPQPSAEADALVVALARALRRRGDPAEIVVLGACLDDFAVMAPGNVLVTGSVEGEDLAPLVQAYGVTELMSGSRALLRPARRAGGGLRPAARRIRLVLGRAAVRRRGAGARSAPVRPQDGRDQSRTGWRPAAHLT